MAGRSRHGRPARTIHGTASKNSRLFLPLRPGSVDLPIRAVLGPGQQNDMAPACDLIRGIPAGEVLADRAHDADSLHDLIYEQGSEPVIPPRHHRKHQHRHDGIACKQRWGIEGFFAKLKQWRRIATRYNKLTDSFLGFFELASIMLWIKRLHRH